MNVVQAIHGHNKTYSIRAGHVSIPTYEKMRELEYDPGLLINKYQNLTPGLYRINIKNQDYGFVLHQNISHGDEVIIKSELDMFAICNLVKYKIIPYRLYNNLEMSRNGHPLKLIAKCPLDVIGFDGTSLLIEPTEGQLGRADHMSIANIKYVSDHGEKTIKPFRLKTRVCSLTDDARDQVYIDTYLHKSLFIFKIGIFELTENHPIMEKPEFSTDKFKIYYYKSSSVKPGSKIWSTHYRSMLWRDMFDRNIEQSGICAGPDKYTQGFWFKLSPDDLRYLHSFRAVNNPVEILYELNSTVYKSIPLDDWTAPTAPFKDGCVTVLPYLNKDMLNELYHEFKLQTGRVDAAIPRSDILIAQSEQDSEYILNNNEFIYDVLPIDIIREPGSIDKPDIYTGQVDAALPKNGSISGSEQQMDESSGLIRENNTIWYNILLSADISTRNIFFYRHLLH